MKYLVLLFVGVFIQNCLGPSTSSVNFSSNPYAGKYAAFLDSTEMIVDEKYHYVVTKLADGTYVKRIFYPDTKTLTSKVHFSNSTMTSKNGLAEYWFDFGDLKSKGMYKNDKKEGEWESYNINDSSIKTKGSYVGGKREGKWIFYEKGVKEDVYHFENGVKNGEFQVFDSLGNVVNFGIYEDGKLVSQDKVITYEEEVFHVVEQLPMFTACEHEKDQDKRKACSDREMLVYIYSNLRYPPIARENGLQGTAIMEFVVDQDGSIIDVVPVYGISDEIKTECLRVIEGMPKWQPGLQDNKPVKVKFVLPIKFKLEG